MKNIRSSIFAISIAISCSVILFSMKPPRELREAERVAAANEQYYAEIFSRCSDIRPLAQFIEIFKPTEALEFFDNETLKEVVSVVAIAETEKGYKASFVAPVIIAENGKYELTGQPKFSIEDVKGGTFIKYLPNGSVSGNRIQLGPVLWNRFIAAGADIETLREVKIHSDES